MRNMRAKMVPNGKKGQVNTRFVVLRAFVAIVLVWGMCVPTSLTAWAEADEAPAQAMGDQDLQGDDQPMDNGTADEGQQGSSDMPQESANQADRETEDTSQVAVQEGSAGQDESKPDDEAEDLAALWLAGTAIDRSGRYVLDDDITVDKPLVIALPKGEQATIDLAGHVVTVKPEKGTKNAVAVDLSDNCGTVTFADAEYRESRQSEAIHDAKSLAPAAGIVLKVENATESAYVIDAVRSGETRDSEPEAEFCAIRIVVSASVSETAAYGVDVAAVRTGADESLDRDKDQEPGTTATNVTLDSCLVDVGVSYDVPADDLGQAGMTEADRGKALAIDAGARGITLKSALKFEEGSAATLASRYDRTFALDPDLALSETVEFGFPAKAEGDEAVVATTIDGKPLARITEDDVSASDAGYVVRFADDRTAISVEHVSPSRDAQVNPDAALAADSDEQVPERELSQEEREALQQQPDAQLISDSLVAFTLAGAPELSAALAAQAEGSSLNDQWASQEGGLNATFTITTGGTYELDGDLEANNIIIVNAPDQDVTIRFNGHTLTSTGISTSGERTLFRITAARSVTLDGRSSLGTSTFTGSGGIDMWGVASTASGCAVAMNDLTLKLASTSESARAMLSLGTHCVRITGGSLEMTRCKVVMDFGNQTVSYNQQLAASEPPSAIYATNKVASVKLVDCAVTSVGTPAVALSDVSDVRSLGNVYALYSRSPSTEVSGGSYSATSARGCATCLYGNNLAITGARVSLQANAGQIAAGVLSNTEGGVKLAGIMSFEGSAANGYPSAMLRSSVENGFVLAASGAPSAANEYSALIAPASLADANASGMRIATFGDMTAAEKQAYAQALFNALEGEVATSVAIDESGAFFTVDTGAAVARIGETYYESLPAAIAALSDGETLEVLRDVGDIVVTSDADAVIDLGGHTLTSLAYTAKAPEGTSEASGLVVRNGAIDGYAAFDSSRAAVLHDSPRSLMLEGVSVSASASGESVTGIYATAKAGDLTLANAQVNVTVHRTSSGVTGYGVYVNDSCKSRLSISDSSILVSTPSVSSSVCGIRAPFDSLVNNTDVHVFGGNGITGGIQVGGVSVIRDCSVFVQTSEIATLVYGIWGKDSAPKAESIEVDGCTVSVLSETDASHGNYWCLLGSSSRTLQSSTSWTLAGKSSFESASGSHLGMNVAGIALSQSFELAEGSDAPLSVSQTRQEGDIGFTSVDGSSLARHAFLFAAQPGSEYDGWSLRPSAADASILQWLPVNAVDSAVLLEHDGETTGYNRLADALADAQAGDVITIGCDLTETGAVETALDDATIDLAGHSLTLRAAGKAAAGSDGTGAALAFKGGSNSVLSIVSSEGPGTLNLEVGSAIEPSDGTVYQGISITSGGTVSITTDCSVSVSYTGMSAATVQRDVSVCGVLVSHGLLQLDGSLVVHSASSDGGIGALTSMGVCVSPASGEEASVEQGAGSTLEVDNATQAILVDQSFGSTAGVTMSSKTVRFIELDPDSDPDFYQAVQDQFRISATFDNPDTYSDSTAFGLSLYYTSSEMTLDAPGKWYDGMGLFAYSDPMDRADVGKLSSIKATYVFASSPYVKPTRAMGIVSDSSTQGDGHVLVHGTVSATCSEGDAYALDAEAGQFMQWEASGADLRATSLADEVRIVRDSTLDLRDFIPALSSYEKPVTYKTQATAAGNVLVGYESPVARGVRMAQDVPFKMGGQTTVKADGIDAADIEASDFALGDGFASEGDAISVANPAGENTAGMTFARLDGAVSVDAAAFEDAHRALDPMQVDAGFAWSDASENQVVRFQVGDAVVGRYRCDEPIDLEEPSSRASVSGTYRYHYDLAGWSTSADEFSEPEQPMSGTVSVSDEAEYHAVYGVGKTEGISVSFGNVRNVDGIVQDIPPVYAVYGETLADVLERSEQSLPEPSDYYDEATGTWYRFAGWHDGSVTTTNNARLWNPDSIATEMELTSAISGVMTGSVVLRATYVPVAANQRLVFLDVDHFRFAYAVDYGSRPSYEKASEATTVAAPSKIKTSTGVTYTFEGWIDESTDENIGHTIPTATADAAYRASFAEKGTDVILTFYYMQPDESGSGAYTRKAKRIYTTYETPVQETADDLVKYGDRIVSAGTASIFEGWSVRETDVEAMYTADSPIDSGSWADRSLSSQAYSKTYYGIYKSAERKVHVEFFLDGSSLGGATVSGKTLIDDAFKEAGADLPSDRSQTEQFLGWNVEENAEVNLDGSFVSVGDLASESSDELVLHAVFGAPPRYLVTFNNAEKTKRLYSVHVARGRSVADILADQGASIDAPSKDMCYFQGWRTASGVGYSFDTPVMGQMNLYASYGDLQINTGGAADVAVSAGLTTAELEDATSVTLGFIRSDVVYDGLRVYAAKAGFTVIRGYDLWIEGEMADGSKAKVDGSVGVITTKIKIGTDYANVPVRVFWMSSKGFSNSDLKQVDSEGYISVTFADYELAYEMEGSNFAVAIVEGGQGMAPIDTGGIGGDTGTVTNNGSLGLSGSFKLSPTGLMGIQASASGSLSSSPEALANSLDSDRLTSEDGNPFILEEETSDINDLLSRFDANVLVVVLAIAAVLALCARGIWRFFAGLPLKRRDDDEDEAPIDASPLALEGIRF